jgi:hypothetical protein
MTTQKDKLLVKGKEYMVQTSILSKARYAGQIESEGIRHCFVRRSSLNLDSTVLVCSLIEDSDLAIIGDSAKSKRDEVHFWYVHRDDPIYNKLRDICDGEQK